MDVHSPPPTPSSPIWDFSTKLCDALPQTGENYVISPISLQLVMAMVYLGARGQTKSEIQKSFNYHPDENAFLQDQKSLLLKLKSPAIRVASNLFADKKFKFKEDYLSKTQSHLLATSSGLYLSQQPEQSRNYINKWVSDQTANKITDLLPQGSINRDSRLVIVNAIYFKSAWKNAFPIRHTSNRPFVNANGKMTRVPMMSIKDDFSYLSSDYLQAQLLQLPYQEHGLSLLVILPFEKSGLAEVEEKLDYSSIEKALNEMIVEEVQVYLPKFKVESSFDLQEPIEKLGARTMFQKSANLSGISSSDDLLVSKVAQKATIEVSEEGTTASAASGVIFETLSLPLYPSVVVNHPFIAIVLKDRIPIFICKIMNL